MKIANPEAYKWAKLRNPDKRDEGIGDPVPVMPGHEGTAAASGHIILEGQDEKDAIAWAKGETIEERPVVDDTAPPPSAAGVRTTTNTNTAKAKANGRKAGPGDDS